MTTTSSTSSTSSLSSLLSALSGTTSTSSSTGSSSSGSTSTSGATVSIPGLGTGLDVSSIVTALVNAEKAPKQAQIDSQTSLINTQASGLNTLQSALESLQSAVSELTASGSYDTFDATLSGTNMGSATATSGAAAGSYALQITQLATAQSRTSDAVASGTSIGSGSLSFTVGSKSVSISVSDGDSLSDIASAINGSAGNPGITATVVNGTDGAHLMVTSTQTGASNGFSVSAGSGSSSTLSALATQLDTAGSNEAQDAKLKVNGVAVDSATNTVSGAIQGVSLSLTTTGSTTLNVKVDNSTTTQAVQDFVTAYNSYASTMSSLSSYDATTKSSGPLLGNPVLNTIRNQVNSIMSGLVSNNSLGSLAQVGVTRDGDGNLTLDTSKLTAALNTNPTQVKDLFAGTSGYGTKLTTALTSFTASNGIIANQQTSLQSQLTSLSSQQTALDKRMAVYQSQLSAEYTNLSTLMSSLNQTSNYLTQLSDQQNKSSS